VTPGGMTTGFATPSADLDLIKIGEARKSLVGVKLDQVRRVVQCTCCKRALFVHVNNYCNNYYRDGQLQI